MKLEKKHLTPYFEHNIMVSYKDCLTGKTRQAYLTSISNEGIETTYKNRTVGDIIGWEGYNNVKDLDVKLILHPLSDLTKEIDGISFIGSYEIGEDDNGTEFDFGNIKIIKELEYIANSKTGHLSVGYLPYSVVEDMYKNHFDVSGLIPQGLAIDINTV